MVLQPLQHCWDLIRLCKGHLPARSRPSAPDVRMLPAKVAETLSAASARAVQARGMGVHTCRGISYTSGMEGERPDTLLEHMRHHQEAPTAGCPAGRPAAARRRA